MVEISPKPRVSSRATALALALLGVMPTVYAQPSNNSPNQFGDRQAGQWGDPAQGHFGNPAAGDFDKSKVLEPPPGTQPMGQVQSGRSAQDAPYVSLSTPADAARELPAAKSTKKSTKAKKRVRRKQASR